MNVDGLDLLDQLLAIKLLSDNVPYRDVIDGTLAAMHDKVVDRQ